MSKLRYKYIYSFGKYCEENAIGTDVLIYSRRQGVGEATFTSNTGLLTSTYRSDRTKVAFGEIVDSVNGDGALGAIMISETSKFFNVGLISTLSAWVELKHRSYLQQLQQLKH